MQGDDPLTVDQVDRKIKVALSGAAYTAAGATLKLSFNGQIVEIPTTSITAGVCTDVSALLLLLLLPSQVAPRFVAR